MVRFFFANRGFLNPLEPSRPCGGGYNNFFLGRRVRHDLLNIFDQLLAWWKDFMAHLSKEARIESFGKNVSVSDGGAPKPIFGEITKNGFFFYIFCFGAPT